MRDGKIEIRPIMNLILNFDHRLIDGAPATRFLNDVQKLMEGAMAEYMHEVSDTEIAKAAYERAPSL